MFNYGQERVTFLTPQTTEQKQNATKQSALKQIITLSEPKMRSIKFKMMRHFNENRFIFATYEFKSSGGR